MNQIEKIESLVKDLPDAGGARRFFGQMTERNPVEAKKLLKNEGLLSDVLTVTGFSPLLAATLLQNPGYVSWLGRERAETKIRSKEELLESLARFSLTNSEIEPQILLSRFRRRELLRVFLRDIRRLGTIAETTEEISNLADAILEYALRLARQELDNRYGAPLEIDDKNRAKPARFCIVSLGKLGSRELNYASDIDLLFLYSTEGMTSGNGTKGAVTNREYFIKLAEFVTKIVGQQIGEGAAYRVDLRLRPHGRVGALAVSIGEALNYYQKSAQAWERQALIRARASAGEAELFKDFFSKIEPSIYSADEPVERALQSVKLSKDKINSEHSGGKGFNVKLGTGGIREIEFIAQALQLAHGGRDTWLRTSHTLISLARLADRGLLSETEMTELFDAYEFLRRLEHRLQMENGLQTHLVVEDTDKRHLAAKQMNFETIAQFDAALEFQTANVNRIFERVFGNQTSERPFVASTVASAGALRKPDPDFPQVADSEDFQPALPNQLLKNISASLEKSEHKTLLSPERFSALKDFCDVSPKFGEMLSANPKLIEALPLASEGFREKQYLEVLRSAVLSQTEFRTELAALRTEWTKLFLEIAAFDVSGRIDFFKAKQLQTALAEASLEVALIVTERELYRRRLGRRQHANELLPESSQLPLAVLGLGKLGGRGMDYGSDLDLVLIYDDQTALTLSSAEAAAAAAGENLTPAEYYGQAVEIFVTTLSSLTREGHLYRVDLRLRPDGKNGATSIGKSAFLNYLETRSAIWEWLAYVKLRGVSGNSDFACAIEKEARRVVHENALKADKNELKREIRHVRERLEQEKARLAKDTNIKFGPGGLLDIYFAMRFLQLRDNVPDDAENRSTRFMLRKLYENKSLSNENFSALAEGHEFLSVLDHNIRLTVGRSNRLPLANKAALHTISRRMKMDSNDDLFEKLSLHRLEIRSAFEDIFT